MELLTISDFYIFLFLISCSADRKTNKQFKVEDVLQKNVVYTKLNYNLKKKYTINAFLKGY